MMIEVEADAHDHNYGIGEADNFLLGSLRPGKR